MIKRIYVIDYKLLSNGRDPRPLQMICTDEKGFIEWFDELINDPEAFIVDMWYVESNKHRLTLTDMHTIKNNVYEPIARFTE